MMDKYNICFNCCVFVTVTLLLNSPDKLLISYFFTDNKELTSNVSQLAPGVQVPLQ